MPGEPMHEPRFIPAYTGNGFIQRIHGYSLAVYPRVYGERKECVVGWNDDAGLSPRIRGTVHNTGMCAFCCRFIPAYTGNG